MSEKEIKKVVFTFDDGTEKVLEGEELDTWQGICLGYSDYLLPGAPDHVLAVILGGLVSGYMTPNKAIAETLKAKLAGG